MTDQFLFQVVYFLGYAGVDWVEDFLLLPAVLAIAAYYEV